VAILSRHALDEAGMHHEHEDDYRYDEWMDSLYEEFRPQAVDEFTAERLQSYYLANRLISDPAARFLAEARQLEIEHPTAALVLAAAAIEVTIKAILLKPVVYGLIHSESTADLITELVTKHAGLDRFKDLLFRVLREHGGVDLGTFRREGASKSLWNEVQELQRRRNAAVHQAAPCGPSESRLAIECGETLLDHIFPTVLDALGLHLDDGTRICGEYGCKVEKADLGASS
jgi:hypothetical protein